VRFMAVWWLRLQLCVTAAIVLIAGGEGLVTNLKAADDANLSREAAKKLKDPVPYSKKSIAAGRELFMANCTGCHGEDGKAQGAIIADATDLTTPSLYKSGTSDGEIFRSIRDGAGEQMPPFKYQMSDEKDMWNLVNFIHSLWPESMRPKLQDDK
jgi:mono/diheme cytochrome c family protein